MTPAGVRSAATDCRWFVAAERGYPPRMRRDIWYFIVGAVLATIIINAIGIEDTLTWVAAATGIIVVTVVALMAIDRSRGRHSGL